MYLFSYKDFKTGLREDENKSYMIEKLDLYSNAVSLEDEPFYETINRFRSSIPYAVPKEILFDYDFELLLALVASSFSSSYSLEFPKNSSITSHIPELYITVISEDKSVKKKISKLWPFQIIRLFEIYLEETINLYTFSMEDENEVNPIKEEYNLRKRKFDMIIGEANTIMNRRKILSFSP